MDGYKVQKFGSSCDNCKHRHFHFCINNMPKNILDIIFGGDLDLEMSDDVQKAIDFAKNREIDKNGICVNYEVAEWRVNG